jgi:hypothetical protein
VGKGGPANSKAMIYRKKLVVFGPSPGHKIIILQFDIALSSSNFQFTQDSNFEGEL